MFLKFKFAHSMRHNQSETERFFLAKEGDGIYFYLLIAARKQKLILFLFFFF